MLRSTISFLFLILYGSNGLIHWFLLVVLLWLHFVFRFLVSSWPSSCKVLRCWRYDILLIGWLVSVMVFIPIFVVRRCVISIYVFSLFVQMQCSKFKWWYLWCCFAVFVFLLPRDWLVDWPVEWYMVLLMIWCLVCLICVPFAKYFLYGFIRLFSLQLGLVGSFINRLVDWSTNPSMFDWLVDRPIDRLIHSLIGWLLAERL